MTSDANGKDTLGFAVIQVKNATDSSLKNSKHLINSPGESTSCENSIAAETEKLEVLTAIYQKDVFTKALELRHFKIKLGRLLLDKRSLVRLSKAKNNQWIG